MPWITLCSLLARSLVRILMDVFKREIGLKSETEMDYQFLAEELHENHLSFEDRLALHESQHKVCRNPA
jgi:hypothetical protein